MRYFSSRSVSDGSATRILRARKTFFLGISSRHTAHPAAAAAATSATLCFMPRPQLRNFWMRSSRETILGVVEKLETSSHTHRQTHTHTRCSSGSACRACRADADAGLTGGQCLMHHRAVSRRSNEILFGRRFMTGWSQQDPPVIQPEPSAPLTRDMCVRSLPIYSKT